MQCACACIAALRDAHCKCSDWPKHCSAAIAVRYDWFYQRRVPTTVGQWVAKLANGTNGARSGTLSSSLSSLAARGFTRPRKSKARGPRATTRRRKEYEGAWSAHCALQRACFSREAFCPSHTRVRAGINLQAQKRRGVAGCNAHVEAERKTLKGQPRRSRRNKTRLTNKTLLTEQRTRTAAPPPHES